MHIQNREVSLLFGTCMILSDYGISNLFVHSFWGANLGISLLKWKLADLVASEAARQFSSRQFSGLHRRWIYSAPE